jgi:acetyl-CoA carboxylase biotin carboxyl carrier protein
VLVNETPSQHEAIDVVGEALSAIRGSSIAELEVEWEGGSVRIARETALVGVHPSAAAEPEAPVDDRLVVSSEHVGIFRGGAGGAFPSVGAWVAAGTPLGEIETLGMRNAVTAPVDGRVEEVLVEDGAPVEYGQRLIAMRSEPLPDGSAPPADAPENPT